MARADCSVCLLQRLHSAGHAPGLADQPEGHREAVGPPGRGDCPRHLWLKPRRGREGGRARGCPASGSHVADRQARVVQVQVQVHGAALPLGRAAPAGRGGQGAPTHFGSWFSWRDSRDLEAPWLDLGKRLAKSSLLQGRA